MQKPFIKDQNFNQGSPKRPNLTRNIRNTITLVMFSPFLSSNYRTNVFSQSQETSVSLCRKLS